MRWVLLLVALSGCREGITGPEPPQLDLAPRIAGTWTGTFDGRLGVVGAPEAVLRDTFHVTFDVARLGADFAYTGTVLRGGSTPAPLYDCQPEPVEVTLDHRVAFACVQGTQSGGTLVLRVEAQADPAFSVLQGTVRDLLGVPETHRLELARAE